MASKTAVLAVRIITETKAGQKGLNDYGRSVEGLRRNLDSLVLPAALALGAITALTGAAVSAASDAQQAAGAVDAVFGAYAAQTKAHADQAAENVGLAESQYNQLASVIGAQLKNMGIPMERVADQTDELITLGADLAATFGGTTADAVAALSSLLRGERDPIERYGVGIKQAGIDAQKAEMGLSGLTGEADTQADILATLALLSEQTADAHGRFAEEADTAAGAMQRANAKFTEAQAALGESLLPYMVMAADAAEKLSGLIEDNTLAFQILIGILAVVAANILIVNAAWSAYETAVILATAAQWLLDAALDANPIGLVIIAIGLLIAIIVLVIQNWDELAAAFGEAMEAIGNWWDDLVASFQNGFDQIIGWIQDVIDWFGSLFGAQAQASAGGGGRAVVATVAGHAVPGGYTSSGARPYRAAPRAAASMAPVNITIQGAIDPDSTARQIQRILTRYGRNQGRLAPGGDRWR